MTVYLYQSSPSDVICMHMGIHSIYKLQAQFLDKIKISVNCSVNGVDQLITQNQKGLGEIY
jgi:hypothetical protein